MPYAVESKEALEHQVAAARSGGQQAPRALVPMVATERRSTVTSRWSGMASVSVALVHAMRVFWTSLRSAKGLGLGRRSARLRPHPAAVSRRSGVAGAPLPRGSEHAFVSRPRGVEELLRRVHAEFIEMPGLRLTAAQAQRMWGIGSSVCEMIFNTMIEEKFLTRTRDGAFVRS
jgi:hypothetical protein